MPRVVREVIVTQMLVRDLPPEVVERLNERARANGRSLQKGVGGWEIVGPSKGASGISGW
jgi:hypothetical protein